MRAIEELRAVHRPVTNADTWDAAIHGKEPPMYSTPPENPVCLECRWPDDGEHRPWPCPTIQTLNRYPTEQKEPQVKYVFSATATLLPAHDPISVPYPTKHYFRALIDDVTDEVDMLTSEDVATVLGFLSDVAATPPVGLERNLARIAAACEQIAGHRVEVEPIAEALTAFELIARWSYHDRVVSPFREPQTYQWIDLGDSAATWLAYITGAFDPKGEGLAR